MGQEGPVGDGACLAVASTAVEPEHKYRSKRAREIGIQAASDELGRRMVAEFLALVEVVHYTALVHGLGSSDWWPTCDEVADRRAPHW